VFNKLKLDLLIFTAQHSEDHDGSNRTGGWIAGVFIGVVIALALIVAGGYIAYKHRCWHNPARLAGYHNILFDVGHDQTTVTGLERH